ncbi:hypothetical protein [Nonomuraea sp. NPDC050691]|uniref:hypothetical protein n=1 Tax=Nonomuraea sp. NPDC050691 TaxID=3155661 RepID=UPI0033DC9DFD
MIPSIARPAMFMRSRQEVSNDNEDDHDNDGPPIYALVLGLMQASHGPLPVLFLEPETPTAGADDLRDRCGWRPRDMTVVPNLHAPRAGGS